MVNGVHAYKEVKGDAATPKAPAQEDWRKRRFRRFTIRSLLLLTFGFAAASHWFVNGRWFYEQQHLAFFASTPRQTQIGETTLISRHNWLLAEIYFCRHGWLDRRVIDVRLSSRPPRRPPVYRYDVRGADFLIGANNWPLNGPRFEVDLGYLNDSTWNRPASFARELLASFFESYPEKEWTPKSFQKWIVDEGSRCISSNAVSSSNLDEQARFTGYLAAFRKCDEARKYGVAYAKADPRFLGKGAPVVFFEFMDVAVESARLYSKRQEQDRLASLEVLEANSSDHMFSQMNRTPALLPVPQFQFRSIIWNPRWPPVEQSLKDFFTDETVENWSRHSFREWLGQRVGEEVPDLGGYHDSD